MRVAFATIGLAHSTKLTSYDQGAEFQKCIKITDFETKTLADDITLTSRDANGCCAAGEVPGAFLFSDYQGAQVVCGTGTGDKSYAANANGRCAYGTCYVYKQHLPCEDGTKQRINGCCGAHGVANMNFPSSCLGYEKKFTNTASEEVEYCTTYHKQYGSIGLMGTSAAKDDVTHALHWMGGSPTTPLMVCQGDCDEDSHCPTGSACVAGTSTPEGCATGDSHDASRDETDYCNNPGGTTAPRLQISCLDEYSACCGHMERNGACNSAADYMAATNAALSTNACTGSVTGDGGNSDGNSNSNSGADSTTTTDNNASNETDNAVAASLGCVALLAAGVAAA
jgi:hypothetical protein